jgi:hypothetical protein
MDCERILLMMRRWGYRGVSYRYLAEVFGMAEEEMVECAKKIGVDVGYEYFSTSLSLSSSSAARRRC